LKRYNTAVILGLDTPSTRFLEEDLDELALLLSNLGIEVVGQIVQKRDTPDPAFLVGKGKASEAGLFCKSTGADILVSDERLSPTQKANLQGQAGIEVWDRAFVIMKIFEARAYSAEAKLQVELARCKYEIPHLKGLGQQMSRAGGGIGTRGPGETEFERHRRKLERRVRDILSKLKVVRRRRDYQRKRRHKAGLLTVSLAGYTNSGKSTLLRTWSSDDTLSVADQLFCTLDTFVRRVHLPRGTEILVSDTVGFIRKLPPDLVAAFRTTLEEITSSDLVLFVVDLSAPNIMDLFNVVQETLYDIGASAIPRIIVLNKIDKVDNDTVDSWRDRFEHMGEIVACTSALNGQGLDVLGDLIEQSLTSGLFKGK